MCNGFLLPGRFGPISQLHFAYGKVKLGMTGLCTFPSSHVIALNFKTVPREAHSLERFGMTKTGFCIVPCTILLSLDAGMHQLGELEIVRLVMFAFGFPACPPNMKKLKLLSEKDSLKG